MLLPIRRRWLSVAAGCALSTGTWSLPVWAQEEADAKPAIDSPLAVEPKSPDELFRAVLFALQLERPEVARRYLDAFMESNPDDEFLLKLRNEFGTSVFMQLARVKELQPTSRDLIDRVRQAALARINDAAVVDGLIDRLGGSARDKDAALVELKHLRAHAVTHLLRRATAELNPLPVDQTIETLVAVGEPTVPALIGALQTGPESVAAIAATALGRIGGPDAELALWYPAFSESSSPAMQETAKSSLAEILTGDPSRTDKVDPFAAAQKIKTRADLYFQRSAELTTGDDGKIGVWTWNAEQKGLVETRTSPEKASLYFAEVGARQALDMDGDSRSAQVLLLATLLARDAETAGWDKPAPEGPGTAHDLALAAGPEMTSDVLELALGTKQFSAAVSALRVLEQNGSRRQLDSSADSARSVLAALDVAEPRVQFAAAETILQWDPDKPFPKSRRVVEILSSALSGDSRPDGVVIDPNNRRATTMGDYLNVLGYDPHIVATGRDGFSAAAKGDVTLAVVHLNAIRWELSQTVSQLRADARTANIPIAIYGPAGMQDRVRHLQQRYPRVTYLEEANNSAEVSRQLAPFLSQVTPPALTEQDRAARRVSAAEWLRHIAVGGRTNVFDLGIAEDALSDAVNDPEVSGAAIVALGAVATPAAQLRLLDAAINDAAEPASRAAAARQLGFHIQRFGLLLSASDVERLEARAAAESDPAAQSAIAAVIGSLRPDPKVVRERLLSYPVSTAPMP